MASTDLTGRIGEFLDRHLVFPLLMFPELNKLFKEQDLDKAKLDLLQQTNMVDFAMDIYKKLHKTDSAPQEMKDKRESVVSTLKRLQSECGPILRVLETANLVQQLRAEKNFHMEYLQQHHGVTLDSVDKLFQYAKYQYDCGNYSGVSHYLYHYRLLSTDPDKSFSALWGKLAAEILMQEWNTALEDLNRLRETIDARTFSSPLQQLQQRTWLMHWSLYVFFKHPNGRNGIIDLFFSDRYLNAMQTNAPHLLRYLTTAVITNKRRRNVLKDLVRVIQQENYTYKDPITEFVECLYVNFDFDGAQQKLMECEEVLKNDFFLWECREEFIENARLFIFETYCRIHQVIDIGMLAEKLNMDQEAAERWIVNLIRNARLDAKIDSKRNHVIMGTKYPSVYQQIIEKTKNLSFRSFVLANNLEKRHHGNSGHNRRAHGKN